MAERRADNRRRRVVWGGVIACLAMVLLALMMWVARPRWRTYTFPPDPKTGMAVAIDYPDDWALDPRISQQDDDSVEFRPLEPNSLLRWCSEHLMGHRPTTQFPTTIRFTFSPNARSTMYEVESSWTNPVIGPSKPFDRVQVTRCQLPAGPTLDIMLHLSLPASNGVRQRWMSHHFMIFLAAQNRDLRMTLGATGSMPEDGSASLDARLREAMRRVRVVQIARR